MLAEGRYTDAVDELIINFAHAPIKKFKIKMTEVKDYEKTLFDQMGGTYSRVDDYMLPNLLLPQEAKPIGIWGQRHKCYLREHKRATYTTLLTSGKLNSYLADVDEQAEKMFPRLIRQMAEREGVKEQLKAGNQFEWVRLMNNIRNRAIEIVTINLIYT